MFRKVEAPLNTDSKQYKGLGPINVVAWTDLYLATRQWACSMSDSRILFLETILCVDPSFYPVDRSSATYRSLTVLTPLSPVLRRIVVQSPLSDSLIHANPSILSFSTRKSWEIISATSRPSPWLDSPDFVNNWFEYQSRIVSNLLVASFLSIDTFDNSCTIFSNVL